MKFVLRPRPIAAFRTSLYIPTSCSTHPRLVNNLDPPPIATGNIQRTMSIVSHQRRCHPAFWFTYTPHFRLGLLYESFTKSLRGLADAQCLSNKANRCNNVAICYYTRCVGTIAQPPGGGLLAVQKPVARKIVVTDICNRPGYLMRNSRQRNRLSPISVDGKTQSRGSDRSVVQVHDLLFHIKVRVQLRAVEVVAHFLSLKPVLEPNLRLSKQAPCYT